jgi:hypothetical protein
MAPTLEGADARVKELLRPAADPSATLGNAAPRQAGPKYHVIRLDHHRLGPRVYVLGLRIHEWHLGAVLVGGTLTGLVAEVWEPSPLVGVIGGLGLWLVLKDWRDLVPSRRDSAAWRIGLHRRTTPLRSIRRSEGLPALAAAVAFAVGLVNLASALTPNIA